MCSYHQYQSDGVTLVHGKTPRSELPRTDQAELKKFKVEQNDLGVVLHLDSIFAPECTVRVPKILSRKVTFSFGQCEFIRNINEALYFNSCDSNSADFFGLVSYYYKDFTNFFKWFAFIFVVLKQARCGPFRAIENEI